MALKGDIFDFSPKPQEDETANDSNKTFTVPAGKLWKFIYLYIEYAATATSGTRYLYFRILDSANDVLLQAGGLQITAGQSKVATFGSGMATNVTTDGLNQYGLPPNLIYPAGYQFQVLDSAAVDATADDMVIHGLVLEADV